MIGIIDYGAGNIRSVLNALERLNAPCFVSRVPSELDRAAKLIFPGVGEARSAMQSLHDVGLIEYLRQTEKPFLGICLGMQLLFDHSTERSTDCLAVLHGTITRFNDAAVKVPHVGWNAVQLTPGIPLCAGLRPQEYFYFVHSYFAPLSQATVGTCQHGVAFAAVVQSKNFYGVQFHPEKSGSAGQTLLKNFIERC
ncbi:MAG: imidazole glycerol phosphate synthase subunit HisH [Ignavibacteriales bacterium]|nr:imidazole glycerol phosphate synthase subunit HisH [Ignavibacteriales bacterium]